MTGVPRSAVWGYFSENIFRNVFLRLLALGDIDLDVVRDYLGLLRLSTSVTLLRMSSPTFFS